jgi:hypothetical protein
MSYLQAAAEWEELYEARSLTLLWRLSNGDRLLSVSAHKLMVGMEIWIRRDYPDGPPNIQKVSFATLIESEAYLALKREELESEGWTEERNS